jgi:diacylglycerol kinase (ATP)
MSERLEVRARARSFVYAARGIRALFVHEPNARIHGAVAVAVVALAGWLGVGPLEWAVLALTIACVLCAEALNASLEALADAVHPAEHPLIARAKDVAAGGVLLVAVASVAVGVSILGPPLWTLLTGA